MVDGETVRESILFCLVGPAGSGKTTLADLLTDEFRGSLSRLVTTTSRPQRQGEVEGESYYFVSRASFEEKIQQDEFFEWEETHGNLYGTSRAVLRDLEERGHDALLVVDIRGALNFRRSFPGRTILVFLVAPSIEELKDRVLGRGTGAEETSKRLKTAEREYQAARDSVEEIDYLVVNDSLSAAQRSLVSIVHAERARLRRFSEKWRKQILSFGS